MTREAALQTQHSQPDSLAIRIRQRTKDWGLWEWFPVALLLQILLLAIVQAVLWLWPVKNPPPPKIDLSTDMSFVEFETETRKETHTRDLSDEIVAVEKLRDDNPVNWNNAVDPTFDFSQRYVALLSINNANEEYPQAATSANIGKVRVGVRLYIDASGKIRDVKILSIHSRGNSHKPFEKEFRRAARRVILYRTRLKNQPYKVGGVAKDFTWETVITFTLK